MTADEVPEMPYMLRIRAEGIFVNCYLAPGRSVSQTAPSYLLGSIARKAAETDPKIFAEWKELMKRVLVLAVREALGEELDIEKMQEVTPDEEPGNEH